MYSNPQFKLLRRVRLCLKVILAFAVPVVVTKLIMPWEMMVIHLTLTAWAFGMLGGAALLAALMGDVRELLSNDREERL